MQNKTGKKLKFFITGSAGNLGQAICSFLIEEGHEVIGFDLVDSNFKNRNYKHFKGDINNPLQLMSALKDCNCVIHSAIFKGDYKKDLNPAFESNILGTFNIYECIRSIGKIKVVLLSSAPVDKQTPINNPLLWKSDAGNDHTYDLTKRLQEEIARDYAETFNIPTIILRLGHVVDGKNGTDLKGMPLNKLNYCLGGWVDKQDVASASFLAAMYNSSNFEIFNIIGSKQIEDPFDIKRTIDKLGWRSYYNFEKC